ncbi:MAG TPA: DinB family protein [Acidobacteriaceae bacterium]|nr:DinB family protein [Acidobacteriaceae bacterium]
MLLKKFFLEQLEREAAASRKAIERVPEGQNTWKPHERSMELGYLASMVATMPGWLAFMIELDELDLNDPTGATFRTKSVESRAELLRLLDEGLAASRKALENTSEAHLNTTWRLKMGDQVLTEGPRYTMIADGALSHLAHHRGQLTVYLRLNEAKVPAIYGPSADEWH